MRSSLATTQVERQNHLDMRQQYKQELDLLIQIKKNELQKTSEMKLKESDVVAQSVKRCQEMEEQHLKQKRERERVLMQESQLSNHRRKEDEVRQRTEDKEQARHHLEQSMQLEVMSRHAKAEQHKREIKDFTEHYNQSLAHKVKEREDEKVRNKQNYEEEQLLLEKMEEENMQFMENIRRRSENHKDVQDFYRDMHKDTVERQKDNYLRTVEGPVLERLRKDLDKEQQELLTRQNMKDETNSFIIAQIKNNEHKREMLEYEQAREDYERLIEDLERRDNMDRETKAVKRAQLKGTLETLRDQIDRKRRELSRVNCLNLHEMRVNQHIKDETEAPCNDQEASFLPGFAVPHERKRQLMVMEQSIKLNNQLLASSLSNTPLARRNTCSSNVLPAKPAPRVSTLAKGRSVAGSMMLKLCDCAPTVMVNDKGVPTLPKLLASSCHRVTVSKVTGAAMPARGNFSATRRNTPCNWSTAQTVASHQRRCASQPTSSRSGIERGSQQLSAG